MATMPSVADCQRSVGSISATETLKLERRRSLMLRRTWRRSLSECAPSMRSSSVRWAMGITAIKYSEIKPTAKVKARATLRFENHSSLRRLQQFRLRRLRSQRSPAPCRGKSYLRTFLPKLKVGPIEKRILLRESFSRSLYKNTCTNSASARM